MYILNKNEICHACLLKQTSMTNFEHKMVLVEYSEKAVAMVGDTKEHKEDLKAMGGKFNVKLVLEGKGVKSGTTVGWIFPKTDQSKLTQYLKDGVCSTGVSTVQTKRLLTRKVDSKRESTDIVVTRAAFDSVLARIAVLEREICELKDVGKRHSNTKGRYTVPEEVYDEMDDEMPTKPLRLLRAKK